MYVLDSVIMEGSRVDFHTSGNIDTSMRKIKVGQDGCPWDASLGENFLSKGEWLKTGGLARVGVSAAVIFTDNPGPRTILSRFDNGHPTMAGKLTPPAGVWESGTLLKAALNELGEEVMVCTGNYLVPWQFVDGLNAVRLSEVWVKNYAEDHNLQVASTMTLDVVPFRDTSVLTIDAYEIYVDGTYQGRAALACEPENGGIEVIFILRCHEAIFEKLLDGERARGQWLHREVGLFTSEALEPEENGSNSLTTKATKVLEIMNSL